MGKEKSKGGVPNRHLHARILYLQQAATYLTSHKAMNKIQTQVPVVLQTGDDETSNAREEDLMPVSSSPIAGVLPTTLIAHLRQIAQKSQTRLRADVKHSMCKVCNVVLIDGQTCTMSTENLSRNGKKPHADVMVVKCIICATQKRFPIGAKRQKRKALREKTEIDGPNVTSSLQDAAAQKGVDAV